MRLLALGALGWAGQEWLLQSPLLLAGGVGALLAWVALFWLERRSSQAEWLGALGLLYDMTLAGVGVWLLAHPQAWWLLFVPAIYAARQYAAWHALMGAFLAPLTVGVIASVAPERFADTATLWGWGAGLLGGHLALAWVAYRPATTPSPEVMEQVTRVLEQTESAHRELRHSYRELAHHYRRLQENLETLNDVVELFTALRQATTPTEAYRLILERLRSRFGASGAALYLADETGFHLRAALGVGSLARLQGTVRVDAPRKSARQAVEQQVRQALETLCERVPESGEDAHAIGAGANPRLLTLPLRTPQRLLGMLTLVARNPDGFDTATENRLHAFLPHLLALVQLYEQIEVMGLRLQEIQALHDLDNLLFTVATPTEIPRRALEVLKSVVPFEYAQLYLPDEEQLTLHASLPAFAEILPMLQFGQECGWQGWLQQKTHLLSITDTHESPHVPDPAALAPIRSLLLINLQSGARPAGVLALGHSQPHFFTEGQTEMVQVLVAHLGLVLERARLLIHLEQLAITDGLTGLHNYRYFQERYKEEVRLVKRYRHPLALMLIDLDNFKQINDRYGHLEGDYLLMQVAEVLQSTLRSTELIARYGGDEFVVLMPSTNLQGAQTAAGRLLQAVSGTRFSTTAGQPELSITLSIGIAAYPETTEDPQQLLELADSALEKAKRTGRNRAVALENTA